MSDLRLCIDVGNTSVSAALFRTLEVVTRGRHPSQELTAAWQWGSYLGSLMETGLLPDKVMVATVVPALKGPILDACESMGLPVPHFLSDQSPLGIEIAYRYPSQVGADRLANSVAVYERYGGPCVVVDFGTATTFDVVSEQGRYEGGIILPGIHMSLESLHAKTALLPAVDFDVPTELVGKDTVASILSGVYFGAAAQIDGLLDRLAEYFGKPPHVIGTGGLATIVKAESRWLHEVDLDITLEGLCRVGRRL